MLLPIVLSVMLTFSVSRQPLATSLLNLVDAPRIEPVLIKHPIPTLAASNPPASSLPTAGAFFVE